MSTSLSEDELNVLTYVLSATADRGKPPRKERLLKVADAGAVETLIGKGYLLESEGRIRPVSKKIYEVL